MRLEEYLLSTSDIVQDVIAQVLEDDEITLDASLWDDLMVDPSERIEIALALEAEFGIVLTAETISSWVTVQDIVDSIQQED